MKRSIFIPASLGFLLSIATPAPAAYAPQRAGSVTAAPDAPQIESIPVKGSKIERVRATIVVRAPVAQVRAMVFDFPRYPEFMPHYKKASIVGGAVATGLKVGMDLEELGGLVRFSLRVEIAPPARNGDAETYDGRLVSGNVRAFSPRWELEALGPSRTRLTLESFFDPGMALATASMVNDGTRDGLRAAALALKSRAEGQAVAMR